MKDFETYQHLKGEPMTERDKQEAGSQSWGKGKWYNFVAPFLPEDCDGLTLIDMGCNAGLFLKLAEDRGFSTVIGVDSNEGAVKKGNDYRDRIGGKYEIRLQRMEDCIDDLPVADYTILVNAHYYFNAGDWLTYLDKLRSKTINCIIVTAKKRENQSNAGSSIEEVMDYFHDIWTCTGRKNTIEKDYDKRDRTLWGRCFKSRLERVLIDSLDNGNQQQRGFLKELDKGKDYENTEYYRRFEDYRVTKGNWSREQLDAYFKERVWLYENIKAKGLLNPIVVRKSNKRIVDGNHRADIMSHLGFESIIVRWVL